MNELFHILERAVIHFFSACSLVMLTFFALRTARRKWKTSWLPDSFRERLLLAAICVFALSTMREAWDVANGQALIKAFTDYASWLTGCGVATWGLYRFKMDD